MGCWAVVSAGWSRGDAISGLPSAPPTVLQHLPMIVTYCHLVPPRHKCWGPRVLKVEMTRVSRMGTP